MTTGLITLEQWKKKDLGTDKRPHSSAKTVAGSNTWAVNYLEQVSRQSAGEVAWLETETQDLISERSLRQCVHCQKTWPYISGSGTVYGFCFKCDGVTCDKPACGYCYPKEQRVDDRELVSDLGLTGYFGPARKQIQALVRQQVWRDRVFNDRKGLRTTL